MVEKMKNAQVPVNYVSQVWRSLIASELVVPTFQTFEFAGLQVNGNSRLLSATGLQKQPILKYNPLGTDRSRYLGVKINQFWFFRLPSHRAKTYSSSVNSDNSR